MKALSRYLLACLVIVMAATACNNKQENADELNVFIAQNKSTLPMPVNERITWTDIFVENNSLCYIYETTNPEIAQTATEEHNLVLLQLYQQLRIKEFKEFLKLVVDRNLDIVYRYSYTATGSVGEVKLTHAELKEALEKAK
ncbi:MAG: hypothetical protein MJZ74_08100 [Muribaculaceae bacterium]|nr:hypothetical protein [Muribaculaceae bacterium]